MSKTGKKITLAEGLKEAVGVVKNKKKLNEDSILVSPEFIKKRDALADYFEVEDEVRYDKDMDLFILPDGRAYFVYTGDEADQKAKEEVINSIDDMGIEAFTPDFQQDIIDNQMVDVDWFDDAMKESYEFYADDIMSEDGEHGNRLFDEMIEEGVISEEDVTEDGELVDGIDLDEKKEEFVEKLCENWDNGVQWYIDNFGERDFSDVCKKHDLYDYDEIAETAVRWDGRGHFISYYDGEELDIGDDLFAYKYEEGWDWDKADSIHESMNEDTVKTKDGKWANVGKDGKVDSGKFRTKKEADAQRKAMFANNYKKKIGESARQNKRITASRVTYITEDIEAMKPHYPNIPDEKFQEIIELDPTYQNGSNNAGTYGKWLLNLANKNGGYLPNLGHITDVLKRFDTSKKQLKNKDIMKFRSVQEVDDYLNDENNYNELSDRQKLRQTQNAVRKTDTTKDAKLVYSDSDFDIYVPKTYEASCKLGRGSSWCTASTQNDFYFNYYTRNGNLYILISKHDPENQKYQFHFQSDSFMDIDDRSINIVEFMKQYPNVKKFFVKETKELVDELGEEKQELTISVDDFANMASSRNMSKDFISACFESVFGEDDSLFDQYFMDAYDLYGLLKNDLYYIGISYPNIELFSRLGINAKNVDELWSAMKENDDIDLAMGASYSSAMAIGSYDECVADFKSAVNETFKKVDFYCDGENISIKLPHDENADPDEVAFDTCLLSGFSDSSYDNSEFFTDLADTFSDKFVEPRYGWDGFDYTQFNSELDYRLDEIINNNSVEESLQESSTGNDVVFGYRIHNDMTDEIFVIISDDKNSLISNIDRAKSAITNSWDEYYDGEKVLKNLEKENVYVASDGDYDYMQQLIVNGGDESVSLGGNEYQIKYIGRESIRF